MSEEKIKRLFMAQYMYQVVLHWPYNDSVYNVGADTLNTVSLGGMADSYLLLRDVSQLEMPEIKNLLKILECGYHDADVKKELRKGDSPFSPKEWLRVYIDRKPDSYSDSTQTILMNLSNTKDGVSCHTGNSYWRCHSVAQDYLRSIGILLPFTYLSENNTPVTIQPDELVAKGWVKLVS